MSLCGHRTVVAVGIIALLSAMLGLSLSPPFSPTARGQGPTVSLDPSPANVSLGDTVDVAVVISNVTDVYSASVHLTFDSATVEVVDGDADHPGVQLTPGTFPGPWQQPGAVTSNVADNEAGTISYDFTLVDPGSAVSGSGTLAYITFRGVAAGQTAVTFDSANLWGPTADQPIDSTSAGGSVVVADAPTDTPEPATNTPHATATTGATATRSASGTPTATRTAASTKTPKPTSTPRATSTPRGTATPRPPQSQPQSTNAAVAAAAAQPTASGGLPSAGTGEMPNQIWRWFFLSGAVIMGLATWAFTFRFYARQKESERFWHR